MKKASLVQSRNGVFFWIFSAHSPCRYTGLTVVLLGTNQAARKTIVSCPRWTSFCKWVLSLFLPGLCLIDWAGGGGWYQEQMFSDVAQVVSLVSRVRPCGGWASYQGLLLKSGMGGWPCLLGVSRGKGRVTCLCITRTAPEGQASSPSSSLSSYHLAQSQPPQLAREQRRQDSKLLALAFC